MSTGSAVQRLSYSSKDNTIRSWSRFETEAISVVSAPGFYSRRQIPDGRKSDMIEIFSDGYTATLKIVDQDASGAFVTSIVGAVTGAGATPIEICDAFNVPHQLN